MRVSVRACVFTAVVSAVATPPVAAGQPAILEVGAVAAWGTHPFAPYRQHRPLLLPGEERRTGWLTGLTARASPLRWRWLGLGAQVTSEWATEWRLRGYGPEVRLTPTRRLELRASALHGRVTFGPGPFGGESAHAWRGHEYAIGTHRERLGIAVTHRTGRVNFSYGWISIIGGSGAVEWYPLFARSGLEVSLRVW